MKEIKVIHTADMHLDRRFSGYPGLKGTKRRMEVRDRFISVMELAKKEKVQAVLIAGDLFDNGNPSQGSIQLVREQFEGLAREGIQVLITPGTHDSSQKGSVWNRESFPGNLHVFKLPIFTGKNIPEANLTVFGAANDMANSSRHIMRDIKLDLDNSHRNKMIMMHGSVPMPWAANEKYFPVTEEEINLSGVDYVALGHYHSYYPFGTRVQAAYSGSPALLDFEENKDKYVLMVKIKDGEVNIEPVKIEQKYEMKEVELECEEILNEEDLIGKLKPVAGKNKILRVVLKGVPGINVDIEGITSRASDYFSDENTFFHVIWKNKIRVPRRVLPDEKTVRGVFISKITQKMEKMTEDQKMEYELALHLGVKAIDEGKI